MGERATGCELVTVREAAELLRIHPRSIWRLSALGEIGESDFPRPVRIGAKTVRWRVADLQRYLDGLAGEVRK